MEKILGIDLGTTNSEVAVIIDGWPRVIEEDGEKILPSVVGLSPAGELLVGTPAKNQYVLRPEETIRSIKRKMGSNERVSLGGEALQLIEEVTEAIASGDDRQELLSLNEVLLDLIYQLEG